MSSAKPLRQSARQSAIRQQELEAEQEAQRQKALREEARREKARQEAAEREEQVLQERLLREQQEREHRSSSRSLSPALSGSSLSSDEAELSGGEDEDENNDISNGHGDSSTAAVPEDDGSNLRANSAVALIYGFLTKFRPLLRQACPLREVSLEDIEAGLTATESNACIEEIHANLLSNMLNRKKAVDATTWQKVLLETLDAKLRTGELEYDQNPLRYYSDYYAVPTPDRAQILKGLIDWVLQEGLVIRQGIEQNNEISRVEPFGFDQAKRIYWHFGDGTLMMYRETKSAKKRKPVWETVASNLEELKALADSFDETVSKAEKSLREKLRFEIIAPEEERLVNEKLKQERLDKKLQRIAELHQLAATRTTRTRSSNRLNHPKYTFDDDEDDFEEDDYAVYRRPSSRRRINRENESESKSNGYSQNLQQHQQQLQHAQDPINDQSNGHVHSIESTDSASRRSSLGHDSDSSIRAALQRTRMGDGGIESLSGSIEREDQGGDYKIEENHDHDGPFSVPETPVISGTKLDPTLTVEIVSQPMPIQSTPIASTSENMAHTFAPIIASDSSASTVLATPLASATNSMDQDVEMN
ncbi:hypothetical protein FBU30_009324 [Linnemannia zychae]|nr:hypothetical protein FBU30_009324 [Linnemannia zychae]